MSAITAARARLGAALLALSACSAPQSAAAPPPAEGTCAGAAPSYEQTVRPLLGRYCLGCHALGGAAGEEHDFTRYPVLHAQHRSLWAQLEAGGMPPQDEPQPSPAERALLARWACAGAPDN